MRFFDCVVFDGVVNGSLSNRPEWTLWPLSPTIRGELIASCSKTSIGDKTVSAEESALEAAARWLKLIMLASSSEERTLSATIYPPLQQSPEKLSVTPDPKFETWISSTSDWMLQRAEGSMSSIDLIHGLGMWASLSVPYDNMSHHPVTAAMLA